MTLRTDDLELEVIELGERVADEIWWEDTQIFFALLDRETALERGREPTFEEWMFA